MYVVTSLPRSRRSVRWRAALRIVAHGTDNEPATEGPEFPGEGLEEAAVEETCNSRAAAGGAVAGVRSCRTPV